MNVSMGIPTGPYTELHSLTIAQKGLFRDCRVDPTLQRVSYKWHLNHFTLCSDTHGSNVARYSLMQREVNSPVWPYTVWDDQVIHWIRCLSFDDRYHI